MDNQLKQLKPISELSLFETTHLYFGEYDEDCIEAIITRVHGGYIYRYFITGHNVFIPYIFPLKHKYIEDE